MFQTTGQFRFAIPLAVVIGIAGISASTFGQPGIQGSNNQDPAGGQFELPGLPAAPLQGGPRDDTDRPAQRVVVNEKFAGWQQASDGNIGFRLDDTIRAQWVMADETGRLSGTVFGIESADVGDLMITLLNNGRVMTSTTPKEDGSFLFPNVRQGTYAIVGWGDNAFFAFSFNVLNFNEAADENVPTELKITAVPNKTTINTDWIQYFASGVRFPVYGRYETDEGEDDPARLYGTAGQSLYLPPARPATSISSHQVYPASDGRLIGRVHQMTSRSGRPVELRSTRIMLLRNDDVYAAVTTDSYGVFEFPEVPAGEYACVAVGQDGLGCIGITVAEKNSMGLDEDMEDSEDDDMTEDMDEELFAPISFNMITSETVGWLHQLAIETAYQRVISRPRNNVEPAEPYFDMQQRGCPGPGSLRPGGYRPQPRNAIPKEERFLPKFNRFIDRAFNQDDQSLGGQNFGGPGDNGQNFGNPNF